MTEKKEAKQQQTKERIVEAALEEFCRFGFSRVTMDELAIKLGMSKKTLYQHFSGKEDVLKSVFSTLISNEFERVSPVLLEDMRRHAPEHFRVMEEWRRKKIEEEFGFFIREGREKGMFRNDIPDEVLILMYTVLVENIVRPEVLAKAPLSPAQMCQALVKVFFEGVMTTVGRMEWSQKGQHLFRQIGGPPLALSMPQP
ncbi:MAG: TetR/AcrR family transcriptional regulator [Ignavibacteria bacterium]|nr:TetR/AcrR family transcriptional regulator [Ignavibacteria bacterium]